MSPLRSALAAATLLAAVGGVAFAQTTPPATPPDPVLPMYDPAQLPAFKGKVAQYTLTPRGDVDGLILDDGTQVQIPPPFSTQIVYAVRPGDSVTIHGLKARSVPMIEAMSVTNDATGTMVNLAGFGGHHHGPEGREGATLSVTGRIREQLHGPRGELNGVLLHDGTTVHLPPPEAERMAASLAVGQPLFASGFGVALPYGKVIMAHRIGATEADAKQVGPGPGMHGWMHGMLHAWGHDGERGPMHGPRGDGPPPPPPAPAQP